MMSNSSKRETSLLTDSLTDIAGISVGHWTDRHAGTGCTVILCPEGAVAGADVRGSAPGTREIALLDPVCMVQQVHAILLSGGSAFGLAAADGVMRWLEERGHGFDVGVTRVPIVPAAILFDLGVGQADVRPDADAGYAACEAAETQNIAQGSVGAGTGATVGKFLGLDRCVKGGVGMASREMRNGARVAALAAVNAAGDVFDPATGQVVAGARHPQSGTFGPTLDLVFGPPSTHAPSTQAPESQSSPTQEASPSSQAGWSGNRPLQNTTLVVVATDVALSKSGTNQVARMAHDGLARAIRPVHTSADGDTVFALSLGNREGDASSVGILAAEVAAQAIVHAVQAAEGLHGIPAARELTQ